MTNLATRALQLAESYGVDIPAVNTDGTIDAAVALDAISSANESYLSMIGQYFNAQLRDVITPEATQNVNDARDILYHSQMLVYRAMTDNPLYRAALNTGLFPPLRQPVAYPDVSPKKNIAQWSGESVGMSAELVASLGWHPAEDAIRVSKGLGDGGATAVSASAVAIWVGAILLILTAIGVVVYLNNGADVARSAAAVDGLARATEDVLARRQEFFTECAERGLNRAACIEEANRLLPLPDGDAFRDAADVPPRDNLAKKIGIGIGLAVVGYIAFRYFSEYAGSKGASDGMKGLRGPKRLASLDDPYPSTYFLEV